MAEATGGYGPPRSKQAKLTSEQREEIRLRYAEGETAQALAAEFGISTSTVRGVTAARDPGRYR